MPGSAGGYVVGFQILDRRGVDDLALVDDGGVARQVVARYSGSAPAYRARCDEVAAKQYDELVLA
jgi:hypothetical protein